MQWMSVVENPVLRNLPFKIELNEFQQIVLTPRSNKHGVLKTRIGTLFKESSDSGCMILNGSIMTKKNVKVADAVYCSAEFLTRNGYETLYAEAPEICVEIVSRSNSKREMNEKKKLYFERGALEVWLCYENGRVEFYDSKKQIEQPTLFPDFPKQIEVFWK